MAGILSKGITLSYILVDVATPLTDLLEIPELGGKADKVEVTSLSDTSKKYINGLVDYGDLEFKFLYDNSTAESNYRVLKGMQTAETNEEFLITFPDTTEFAFSGEVSVTIDAAKPGDALQFTLSITPSTDIVPTNPTVIP